tara:strand:- start:44 stop:394 length:351 start_codon:yes stop_codon:yes gene_type:complete
MIKNCYFAVSAADGTAGDEEIACCNLAFFSHFEAETATTTALFFNTSQEIGKDTPTTKIVLTHTSAKHKEVMQAITQTMNSSPNSDGFLVIADSVNSVFASSLISACTSVTVTEAA